MTEVVLQATPLAGLQLVRRLRKGDARGFFSRFFDAATFAEASWPGAVEQMNHTLTESAGTVRGLHFQYEPHGEWKYVSCLAGAVFDVAVDLRAGSPTHGRWFGTVLSADNSESLLIPAGFAHGFQTLVDGCELIYLHSARYSQHAEGGLDAVDPALGIEWPMPISARSDRDMVLPGFNRNMGL